MQPKQCRGWSCVGVVGMGSARLNDRGGRPCRIEHGIKREHRQLRRHMLCVLRRRRDGRAVAVGAVACRVGRVPGLGGGLPAVIAAGVGVRCLHGLRPAAQAQYTLDSSTHNAVKMAVMLRRLLRLYGPPTGRRAVGVVSFPCRAR